MVQLETIDEEHFQDYLHRSLISYAEEHVRAGNWEESKALQRAEEQFSNLLPRGKKTEGQHILMIVDKVTKHKIGVIWFAEVDEEEERVVFLFDIILPYNK